MIVAATGDLLAADAEALVNPINCEGAMGKGLALAFKRAFPAHFTAYRAACARGEVQIGRMFVTDSGRPRPRWLVGFPTKRGWRTNSRLADIEAGLAALTGEVARLAIASIAIPALGCGLGGLAWDAVRPVIESPGFAGARSTAKRCGETIERAFAPVDTTVLLYAPIATAPRSRRRSAPA